MDPAPSLPPSTSGANSPTTSPISALSASGGATEFSVSTATVVNTAGSSEHLPLRRRLVKASSINTKREGSGSGAGSGPPGFGVDRSVGTSPNSPIVVVSASSPGVSLVAPVPSGFRERAGIRPSIKGDGQGDYPVLSHLSGATAGPVKLIRSPFAPSPGLIGGEIRPLGRRPEMALPRRHDTSTSAQKHTQEDLRIQQAKRVAWARASSMGATGNYKEFDSPFGNYMVPVIPNHLFNKTPLAVTSPMSSFGLNASAGR